MHGAKSSFARAWYRLGTGRRLARNEWSGQYWEERDGQRIVPCRRCPKFDAHRGELESIADLQTNGTVWLLAVTAVKRRPSA